MKIDDWGLIEYEASTLKQIECVNAVSCGDAEQVIFCSHPPVVTLGRGTEAGDLTGWNGATVETSRGGRATYHGPSQLVIYPILDLKREREGVKPRDVHSYLRALESIVVAALRELGMVEAEARTTVKGADSLTGVWVGEHKIASIGIAVRKWITYHGVAVNVLNDPSAHQGIKPCGFSPDVMTSVERELGRVVAMQEVKRVFRRGANRLFAKPDNLAERHQ